MQASITSRRGFLASARPTAAYDAKWGGFATKPDAFTKLIYAGV